MATKVSVVLIVVFLITLPVLAGRPGSAAVPVTTQEAFATEDVMATEAPTAEATAEATAVVVALTGDPVRGEDIFRHGLNDAPPCVSCHNPTASGKAGFAIGPGLKGISERGATRIEGMTAAQYIEDSIRNPGNFSVPGYQASMYPLFAEKYSDQDIADVVAFLLTL